MLGEKRFPAPLDEDNRGVGESLEELGASKN